MSEIENQEEKMILYTYWRPDYKTLQEIREEEEQAKKAKEEK